MENVTISPFHVIGISVRTTNQNGQAAKDIALLWDQFLQENILELIPGKVDNTIYSIYTDYESDHTRPYTTIIGCKVHQLDVIPEGLTGKSFNGGKYIKLSSRGDLTKNLIANQWYQIWEMDLERVFTADFEVFGEKARDPHNAEIDFLIAVK